MSDTNSRDVGSRPSHESVTGLQMDDLHLGSHAPGLATTWTEALCELAVALLPGVVGSAVSTCDNAGVLHPEAADDDRTLEIEQLQQVAGEGPGQAARTDRQSVLVDDLDHETERWPGYVDAVHGIRGLQIGAIWSEPVLIEDASVGSLTLYFDSGAVPDPVARPEIVALAGLAAATLTIDADLAGEFGMAQRALNLVDVASGVLAVQAGVGVDEALALLRGRAFSTGRRISDIAADVSAGVADLR